VFNYQIGKGVKMCKHNDEDYTCENCCYEQGYEDAMNDEPYEPEYKNFSQVDEYKLGYDTAMQDKSRAQ
jgi:hypothetical protein